MEVDKKVLSVVIPCFNEEKTIHQVLISVLDQPQVGEVIVIDDCSKDASVNEILRIKDSRVTLVRNRENRGKGFSIAQGLKLSTQEYVVIQDADLEYDPNEYCILIKPLLDGKADVVFGSRFLTSSSRRVLYFWHRLGNAFLTLLSNVFTNLDLTDMETCYKMFSREVAHKLVLKEERFGIEPEITAKIARMKVRIFEVPISYNGRTYQEGKKITWKDGFSAIRCIIKYRFLG